MNDLWSRNFSEILDHNSCRWKTFGLRSSVANSDLLSCPQAPFSNAVIKSLTSCTSWLRGKLACTVACSTRHRLSLSTNTIQGRASVIRFSTRPRPTPVRSLSRATSRLCFSIFQSLPTFRYSSTSSTKCRMQGSSWSDNGSRPSMIGMRLEQRTCSCAPRNEY